MAEVRRRLALIGAGPIGLEMAAALNMTLVFPDGESELVIVCGAQRIKSTPQTTRVIQR
mgnify:CR=1 FL=1